MNIKLWRNNLFVVILGIFGLTVAFSSCTNVKKLHYFTDLPETTLDTLPILQQEERIIEVGDEIEIFLSTPDTGVIGPFLKLPANPSTGGVSVYKVNPDGRIEMSGIGSIPASGSTTAELKKKISNALSPFINVKKLLIEVKFTTFKVTMMGEVRSPGTVNLPISKNTILHALAAAGDLPSTAMRYDIKLFREYNGKRTVRTIDLRSKEVLTNPDIYLLKPNDVIYVKLRKASVFKEDLTIYTTIFTIVVSGVSLGLALTR